MSSNRSERMGGRTGFAGWIDRLRYHEASRQGIGLLLVLACAWFVQPGEWRIVAGLGLAVVGQVWRIYAAGVIYKNRQLATTGAYSLVRHPLYLGNLLILAGFLFASGHLVVILAGIAFFAFYYPAAVRYEDAKLERIFEQDWRDWSGVTPAVFPRSLRWRGSPDAQWNARQSLIRNGELIISVYLVGCAVWLCLRA